MIKLTNAKSEIRRVWAESQEKLLELKDLKSRNHFLEQQNKRADERIQKIQEQNASKNGS